MSGKGAYKDIPTSAARANPQTGLVTQGTSNATTVVLNAEVGVITMFGVLNATTAATFTCTNAFVTASSIIMLCGEADKGLSVSVASRAAGTFNIVVYNPNAGNTAAAPKIHFSIRNL